jgi:hypothetical protein
VAPGDIQRNMDATFAQFGLNERIPRINGHTHCSSLISLMSVHHCASILKVRLGACWNCILTQSISRSGVAGGGGVSRGSRTPPPPIMPEKIFDRKEKGQYAIVLRLYRLRTTFYLLLVDCHEAPSACVNCNKQTVVIESVRPTISSG